MIIKFIQKQIRLFRIKNKEPYLSLYQMLGFYPNNAGLYKQAFIHRSVPWSQTGKRNNNERLEYLGDAVLDAIIADIVYNHFPTKKEGFLTNMRSKIVQRESLNNIALALGIDKKMTSMPYAASHHKYMYGNALEALIGAIYLDQGYDRCRKFVDERIIRPHISLDKLANQEVNFKSRLLEWGQKTKIGIKYELIETHTDKEGNPIFQSSVLLEGIPIGVGVGKTKKESQQLAAKTVIRKIQKDKEVQQLIEEMKQRQTIVSTDASQTPFDHMEEA